jgi:hypothetical protein
MPIGFTLSYSREEQKRYSLYEQFYAWDLEWADIRVVGENEVNKLKETLSEIERQIEYLKIHQPKCMQLLDSYSMEFSKYSLEIDKIIQKNNHGLFQLNDCLFSKVKIKSMYDALDAIRKLRAENWEIMDPNTIEYATRVMWRLISLKDDVETDRSKLFGSLEKMAETFAANKAILYELLNETHEWVQETPERKRCIKCSKEILNESKISNISYAVYPHGQSWDAYFKDIDRDEESPKPVRDSEGFLPSS